MTPSGIIIFEIPGYDVIYIPKPYPFVSSNANLNMQQPLSSVSESSTNAHFTDNLPQNQQQNSYGH
jgi:hypothetical protein